jgi:hypothetical protein
MAIFRTSDVAKLSKQKWLRALVLILLSATVVLLVVTLVWKEQLEPRVVAKPRQKQSQYGSAELASLLYQRNSFSPSLKGPLVVKGPYIGLQISMRGGLLELGTGNPALRLYARVDDATADEVNGLVTGDVISVRCSGVAPGLETPILQNCALQTM